MNPIPQNANSSNPSGATGTLAGSTMTSLANQPPSSLQLSEPDVAVLSVTILEGLSCSPSEAAMILTETKIHHATGRTATRTV
jgi:hypothetical protein